MVCNRCIFVVENILSEMKLTPIKIDLGEVDFGKTILKDEQLYELKKAVEIRGFELLDTKTGRLIEKTKNLVLVFVQNPDKYQNQKLSNFLKDELTLDYNYVSNIFSATEGVTIEHYSINLKIELVKELLIYDELSLSEISHRLNYSSVSHLSTQFKKTTGMTPSQFKKINSNKFRIPLDEL